MKHMFKKSNFKDLLAISKIDDNLYMFRELSHSSRLRDDDSDAGENDHGRQLHCSYQATVGQPACVLIRVLFAQDCRA